jgi:sugar lactone lactonase YvrE
LGRIYAGTAGGEAGSNRLFRFEKEHQAELILTGISCSNGMTFSLDGKSFFHTNTAALRITEYDYDRDSGNISNGQVFFQGNENMGLPDGLTLDSEGCIWVAFWDGSAIRRFSPDGEILETIKLPAKRPTSIIFGGQELNELYITTASVGRISANNRVNKDGEFLGGGIYSFKPRVHGRSEWLADF